MPFPADIQNIEDTPPISQIRDGQFELALESLKALPIFSFDKIGRNRAAVHKRIWLLARALNLSLIAYRLHNKAIIGEPLKILILELVKAFLQFPVKAKEAINKYAERDSRRLFTYTYAPQITRDQLFPIDYLYKILFFEQKRFARAIPEFVQEACDMIEFFSAHGWHPPSLVFSQDPQQAEGELKDYLRKKFPDTSAVSWYWKFSTLPKDCLSKLVQASRNGQSIYEAQTQPIRIIHGYVREHLLEPVANVVVHEYLDLDLFQERSASLPPLPAGTVEKTSLVRFFPGGSPPPEPEPKIEELEPEVEKPFQWEEGSFEMMTFVS